VPLERTRPRARALLAALLVRAGRVVPVARLLDDLWAADPPETAVKIVQTYVAELRRALEPGAIVTRPPGYALAIEPEAIDAHRFDRAAAEGRSLLAAGRAADAAMTLREALSLWRGPALAEFVDDAFAQVEAVRLEELRLAALEDRVEADLQLGAHAALTGELEALVAEHPLRERLRAQLMIALYRAGRQADALRSYRDARELLVGELGIEPGPLLQRLERAILVQDSELEPPAATRPEVAHAATPEQMRKSVTALFVALAPAATLDPEALPAALARARQAVARAVERHGGMLEEDAADRVAAVFGVPVAREDDALRALRAAADAVADVEAPLVARVTVNTGETVVGTGPAGVALRLPREPERGEILVGGATAPLVRGAATLEDAGAGVFRLAALAPAAEPVPRRLDTPLVGRDDELAQLRHALDRAARTRGCTLFTILGPAGIGKSRLAAELAATAGATVQVVSGRCPPYGEGIAFRPLDEIVRTAVGDDVRAGVAAALAPSADTAAIAEQLAGGAGGPAETAWAARKLFESLARKRPLVVVLDDLQWASAALLDLVENVAELARDAPLLLLCLARPELLEERPAWSGGKLNAVTLLLEPLRDDEVERLIGALDADLPEGVRARVADAADGNPLFVEQMVALLREDGAPAGEIRVPPTIQALLAARLDRLAPVERAALQRAAVVGKEFARSEVAALLPAAARDGLDACLDSLVRKDLVVPRADDDAYRFRHGLVRDAAYGSLPKQARADLHERVAAFVDDDGLAGHHLEQASRYREELGEPDAALAGRAAERLAVAGRRVYAAGDAVEAVDVLRRAETLLPRGDPRRPELLVVLSDALRGCGEFEQARAILADAVATALDAGDGTIEWRARVGQLRLQVLTDVALRTDELRSEARRALEELRGDDRGLGEAWSTLAWIEWVACRAAATEEAARHAIEHARRAGDEATEGRAAMIVLGALLFGPTPIPDALRLCDDVRAGIGARNAVVGTTVSRARAGLLALGGRFDEARELVEQDKEFFRDRGLRLVAARAAEVYAFVHLAAGDAAAAELELRTAFETVSDLGEQAAPTFAAMLARALAAQGRNDEAYAFSVESERTAGADDLTTQVQWRGPRALVLARRGETAEAERLAREAVALAAQTDFVALQATALEDLAAVTDDDAAGAEAARLRARKRSD
jgi:DNA-binding SARP family transcriptional activator